MSILDKITVIPFDVTQYFQDVTTKQQIYVHHTAGNPDPYSVVKWWASTTDRVATSFIVGRTPTTKTPNWKDGDILQCYGTEKWAHHLGLKAVHTAAGGKGAKSNLTLNQGSIGIEICNWGQLTKGPKGFVSYVGTIVADDEVQEYTSPFRGYTYYQKYTTAQLDSVHGLLGFLCDKWGIGKAYQGDRIFDICPDALRGASFVYTHASVRPDKSDAHPQKELIDVLKSI